MKISVYITSYNQKEFLKEAIESVLKQTLQPFEILIIDDCSTDGSQEFIKDYQAKYPNLIKYHFNPENLGITKSRNKALSLVSGDYVTWLDGDDIYKPNKLETEFKLLKDTNSDLVYSNFYYAKDAIDNIFQIWCSHINQLPKSSNVFSKVIARQFPKNTLFRYELVDVNLIKKIGQYDEHLKIYEDFDFRIRLCEFANTAYNFETVSVYRIHSNGLSKANKDFHKINLDYIFKKYEQKLFLLDKTERKNVENAITTYMSRFDNEKVNDMSFAVKAFNKIKNKLRLLE